MKTLDRYELADVGISNGAVIMITTIVRVLEANAILQTGEFATAMEELASAVEKERDSPFPPGVLRMDLTMLRQVARNLRKLETRRGWKPVAIDGGLSYRPNQED
jgi:hypothetical protein